MWMDWDDPDELRRLRDALAADPGQVVTIKGPNGPLTDTAEMLVGRLGHPELGGSYYTFSNENNDLIWGFLAECHRRGWIYKGHDSMPWCPRCGTGLSQMEVNEGYQDREDPGLTVRFPLVDRPREAPGVPYEHRVIPWSEVGEDEGTGIVHIAPGAGAEDFQLGKSLGLPVIGPIDEDGRYYAGFDWLTGREAAAAAEAIVDDLERRGFFYHLAPYTHRYPHCWRCGTPLLFRLVDEWFISMGEVYERDRQPIPRSELTKDQVDASLRYQIMEIVDQIHWIPGFGYGRELDWLQNMHDWMISKKRY